MSKPEEGFYHRLPGEPLSWWQPIETVPEDVEMILGYQMSPGDLEHHVSVCWKFGPNALPPVWIGHGGLMPTHWMPLPPPPVPSPDSQ